MRPILKSMACISLAASLSACSSMTVRADHDSQIDFGSYRSFALFELPAKERRGPQMSELVDRRIASSIASELAGKGLATAAPDEADVLVTFYTAVRKRVTVNGGGWYGCCWGYWGGGVAYINSYPEGTLVIDVVDRKSRNLVWRGVGDAAFAKMNPSDEKVEKKVARVLQAFPPGS